MAPPSPLIKENNNMYEFDHIHLARDIMADRNSLSFRLGATIGAYGAAVAADDGQAIGACIEEIGILLGDLAPEGFDRLQYSFGGFTATNGESV